MSGKVRTTTAWIYSYAYGWMIGTMFGVALLRAYISGGEWWIFPPILLIVTPIWIVLFDREVRSGEGSRRG